MRWVSFIWCFSHRPELSLKDSLKVLIEALEQAFNSLFYLYKTSSKKLCELKLLASILKEIYIFDKNSICPEKIWDTRWIDHRMMAMGALNDKLNVYAAYLGNVIANTRK